MRSAVAVLHADMHLRFTCSLVTFSWRVRGSLRSDDAELRLMHSSTAAVHVLMTDAGAGAWLWSWTGCGSWGSIQMVWTEDAVACGCASPDDEAAHTLSCVLCYFFFDVTQLWWWHNTYTLTQYTICICGGICASMWLRYTTPDKTDVYGSKHLNTCTHILLNTK